MDIALVTETYWPRVNGVAVSVETFARELHRMGHTVTVLAPAFPDCADEGDIEVIRIPSHYLWFDPEDRLPNPWLPSARHLLKGKFFSRRFDVIHTQTPFTLGLAALSWAKRTGSALVHTYHTMFESYLHYIKFIPRPLALSFTRGFSRWYCQKMDRVVAPSTQMKELLVRYGVTREIDVIPTGLKSHIFHPVDPGDFRSRYGLQETDKVLLFAGRVAKEKNIPFLFDVLSGLQEEFPDSKLFIAGDGPARKDLEQLAAEQGLADRVIFAGYLSQDDLATCYAAADIFSFASETETQGLVVIEAMAVGTPVVAVGRMGVAEVMAPGRGGFMVEPDAAQFAEKVRALLVDPALAEKKKKEALAYAQEWTAAAMAKRLETAFEKAVAEKR